jgi:ABC-type multidrug transport system fused ATPase/permease subunit
LRAAPALYAPRTIEPGDVFDILFSVKPIVMVLLGRADGFGPDHRGDRFSGPGRTRLAEFPDFPCRVLGPHRRFPHLLFRWDAGPELPAPVRLEKALMNSILELKGVSRKIGGLTALDEVSFQIKPGEIVGLIGPNGAGKTTLVNLVTAVYGVSRGKIFFDGQRIDGMKSHEISRRGVARTFQIVQPFPKMTVWENVPRALIGWGGT